MAFSLNYKERYKKGYAQLQLTNPQREHIRKQDLSHKHKLLLKGSKAAQMVVTMLKQTKNIEQWIDANAYNEIILSIQM